MFCTSGGLLGGSVVKNLPANAVDAGLISELGRFPGEETHSSILAWKIPWTEEAGGLQRSPWGHQESDIT